MWDFIGKPETRLKERRPDFGEFIILVILILVLPLINPNLPLVWEDICEAFLEEGDEPNVRWVLDPN